MIAVLLARLRREDGVAMVAVMGALLVVSLSAAALAAGASQTNTAAIKDSDSKRALAAAEAGLNVATQRYESMRSSLLGTECLAGTGGVTRISMGATATAANTECPAVTGGAEVGEGAGYSYVISMPGAACRAAPNATTSVMASDRCITSTGTVNGVRRRVQTRLGLTGSAPFFNLSGLIGLDSLSFTNSNTINAGVGSNGPVTIGNKVRINGDAVLGPAAPDPAVSNGGQLNGSVTRRDEPYTLDLAGLFDWAKDNANNDNDLLGSALPANRHLTISSGTLTVPVRPDGKTTVYYLCNIYLDNKVDVRIPSGREVRVFVDSPTRPGSACTSGGKITFNNSICVNVPACNKNNPGLASNLEFYLAGTGGQDLVFNNSTVVSALFYAPNSIVDINNSIWLNGALAAKVVNVNNSIDFRWPADARDDGGPNRRASWSGWFECSSRPTVAADPESGC